jgi:hypothetical protein
MQGRAEIVSSYITAIFRFLTLSLTISMSHILSLLGTSTLRRKSKREGERRGDLKSRCVWICFLYQAQD